MTDLAKLVVKLEAQSAQLTAELGRARSRLEKFDTDVSKIAQRIGAGVGAAGAAAATALGVMVKNSIDAADELSKLSQKIGISTENLSKLNYAAGLAGVETGALQTALQKLSRAAVETAQGTGSAKDAFAALGVSVKNADGTLKDNQTLLLELADAFAKVQDGPAKTAAAMDILGKSGADLIPLMNGGAEAIRDAGVELDKFGGVLAPEAGRAAEEFNDNLSRLKTAAQGVANQLAAEMLPSLVGVSGGLVDAAKQGEAVQKAVDAIKIAMDAAAVAAALWGSRIAGLALAQFSAQVYASVSATLAARAAAAEMGVAVAAMGARSAAAAASIGALRGVMALLGGPAGVAIAAALGVTAFIGSLESAEERSARLSTRLKELRGDFAALGDTQELEKTQQQIATIDKQIAQLQAKLIARQTTNAGGQGALDRFLAGGEADKLKALAEQRAKLILIEAQLQDRIDGVAAATTTANAAQEEGTKETLNYADALTKVGTAAEGAAKATSVYDDMLELSKKLEAEELERAAAAQEALNDAVRAAADVYEATRTPLEKYRAELEKLDMLRARFDAGLPGGIDDDTYRRAVGQLNDELARTRQGLDDVKDKGEDAFGSLSVFADEAARNMQDALADFLFDPFAEGLDGMLKGFADTLQRMAAQAAAAEIFGGFKGEGALGGLLGPIGAAVGDFFGGGGATAGAIDFANQDPFGPVQYLSTADTGGWRPAGEPQLIGTGAQPELFVPDTAGTFYPAGEYGGSTTININIPISAPRGSVSRETMDQVAAAALSGANRAMRRNR